MCQRNAIMVCVLLKLEISHFFVMHNFANLNMIEYLLSLFYMIYTYTYMRYKCSKHLKVWILVLAHREIWHLLSKLRNQTTEPKIFLESAEKVGKCIFVFLKERKFILYRPGRLENGNTRSKKWVQYRFISPSDTLAFATTI